MLPSTKFMLVVCKGNNYEFTVMLNICKMKMENINCSLFYWLLADRKLLHQKLINWNISFVYNIYLIHYWTLVVLMQEEKSKQFKLFRMLKIYG
jgi:hypothetical protein